MDLSLLGFKFYPDIAFHEKFSEPEFLAEYQKYQPLQPGFEERKLLYQLYHYLHRRIVSSGSKQK
jgi:fructosamine-3-kinase